MQRLSRLSSERGAVAVWVAILIIPFMVLAALAIDVGAMHADRQRLQTGVDAAALAIAQDCARDGCSEEQSTAEQLTSANDPFGGSAVIEDLDVDETAGWVEVETFSNRDHWFARVIDNDDATLRARGAASWGAPTGGPAVLPIAFSWCELNVQAGFPLLRDPITNEVIGLDVPPEGATLTIHATKSSDTGCTGPSENYIPGGFGWLDPTANCGPAQTELGVVGGDNGGSPPNGCTAAHFDAWIGETVLLPIFDTAVGQGTNATYNLIGYAAFRLESYYFTGGFRPSPAICHGDERCVRGTFLEFVELDSDFQTSPDAPDFGATVVQLRLPQGG